MTLETLKSELRKLVVLTSPQDDDYVNLEEPHHQADKLLLEFIGDADVNVLFHKINKWYA
jgi:hypothetical protein